MVNYEVTKYLFIFVQKCCDLPSAQSCFVPVIYIWSQLEYSSLLRALTVADALWQDARASPTHCYNITVSQTVKHSSIF